MFLKVYSKNPTFEYTKNNLSIVKKLGIFKTNFESEDGLHRH